MSVGKLIGKGNTAEVYHWGESEVIKLFDKRIPTSFIESEYQSNLQIGQLGLPCPLVIGIKELDGRKGLIYERAEGKSLTALLTKNPFSSKQKAQIFSDLHWQIHQAASAVLPKQKDSLRRNIEGTPLLTEEEKHSIGDFLDSLPAGDQVCHMDFHPDNILISKNCVKVIDWMTAASGNPLGDIARTYVILKHACLPKSMPLIMRFLISAIRIKFLQHYLEDYCNKREFTMEEIEKWSLPVMAARLVEGIHPDERMVLLKEIRLLYNKYI